MSSLENYKVSAQAFWEAVSNIYKTLLAVLVHISALRITITFTERSSLCHPKNQFNYFEFMFLYMWCVQELPIYGFENNIRTHIDALYP